MALTKLGTNRITSLLDESENAILCDIFYEPTRDEVLRSHPWSCAKHRQSLAMLAENPAFGYKYQHQLPTNPYCLRVIEMNPKGKYVIEGDRLLTDLEECAIKYIKRIEDPTQFDSLLVKAIATRLAAELSVKIKESVIAKDELIREYDWILKKAEAVDSLESQSLEEEKTLWTDAGR